MMSSMSPLATRSARPAAEWPRGLAACFLAAACSGRGPVPQTSPAPSSTDATHLASDGGSSVGSVDNISISPSSTTDEDAGAAAPTRCRPASGTTGSPRTMTEVVQLINGLPMPVTIPCFLQSLTRPLKLYATSSVVSAQPANGFANPRLFILGDGISLSLVPFGDSSHLLEIGEFTSINRSIKGEIDFPVTAPLSLEAPLERIHGEDGRTVCRICHHPEVPLPAYPVSGAFESTAYRPIPRLEVNFDYVEFQHTTCDRELEPERCDFYAALFDQGQVSRGEFPPEMPTFE